MHLTRLTTVSVSLLVTATSVLAAEVAASRPSSDLELAAGPHLKFATQNDHVSLTSLGTSPQWAGAPSEKMALWRVSVRGPDGKATDLTSAEARVRGRGLTSITPISNGLRHSAASRPGSRSR